MRFGRRLQFSVYEIENSSRILDNIIADINNQFMKQFTEADSVLVIKLSETCKITRLGYAKHEESDFIIV
jgi:CRISPR-associated protein Cas2